MKDESKGPYMHVQTVDLHVNESEAFHWNSHDHHRRIDPFLIEEN